ncbi:growth/differentiation factor 10-like [Coregonus clupeaformis]|uniref:growth/differentiation factor 10-like n=1 Tax=Coregonus clupeaformis TaxID=59861 RepID=UPI001BDFA848|nr:growth/differentiation factor 10-like [Coregonus clupeaformis]
MAVWFEFSAHMFFLLLGSCLGALEGRTASRNPRSVQGQVRDGTEFDRDSADHDVVSQHMHRLYEKYNRELNQLVEGNTVRSFRASQDSSDQKTMYHLNLTSLQDFEIILSATFHFLFDWRPRPSAWFCKRYKTPACRSLRLHPASSIHLLLRSDPSGSEINPGSQGSLLGSVTFHPHRRGSWQMKDVTASIKEAREKGSHFVSVEVDFGLQYHRKPEDTLSGASLPYLLVYADDQELDEPNSLAQTLQRYDPEAEEESPHSSLLHAKPGSKDHVRREVPSLPYSIQNNELPEVEFKPSRSMKEDPFETAYHALKHIKPKLGRKERRRKGEEVKDGERDGGSQSPVLSLDERTPKKSSDGGSRSQDNSEGRRDGKSDIGNGSKSPMLSFDERTLRKARRRQWGSKPQVRSCSRRTLRVDFADIGWSEWVLAPKAFDAYYCAGTCGFPMPKVLYPSNHATIQSIVRAVGIVPGVPEPCCVPEKMSPLGVLYHDEGGNLVLKVYPSMSVESCACR